MPRVKNSCEVVSSNTAKCWAFYLPISVVVFRGCNTIDFPGKLECKRTAVQTSKG